MTPADSIRETHERGYCVLHSRFPEPLIAAAREAFWPILTAHIQSHEPNRGPNRYFLPLPFARPCFAPEFFFDPDVLAVVRGVMDERIVADQWGCDVPLWGSACQDVHVDFRRPLFAEAPDLLLPPFCLLVSFGLVPIARENGPIEIAAGTHRLPRAEGFDAVASGAIALQPVPLAAGDVLIRNPWVLHRGTPNTTHTPRALATIRYVRRWYSDDSREAPSISQAVWRSLSAGRQALLRFPVEQGTPG